MDSNRVTLVVTSNSSGPKCGHHMNLGAKRWAQRWNVRNFLVASLLLSLIIGLLNPGAQQQLAEGAKLKKEGKKLLVSLAKGFVVSTLTTRKNFMPLPVPIPVPIELSEPPVYLKGKPKYINVYKPAPPVVKPTTVYHMPVYSPTYQEYSTSMMDPTGLYGPAMMGGKAYHGMAGSQSMMKHSLAGDANADSALNGVGFNDFDDDSSNYYTRKSSVAFPGKSKLAMAPAFAYADAFGRRFDGSHSLESSGWRDSREDLVIDEQESADEDDEQAQPGAGIRHHRVKRQVYMTSHDQEGPCYGFPLEVNVKSRIKLDSIFPIYGKSQHKKCIKVGRPLLPPVEDPYK